ncbi:MAG: site-specific integrase [Candidatus Methanomethylicaceae archaeon]
MGSLIKRQNGFLDVISAGSISYLTEKELNRLTEEFERYLETPPKNKRKYKYWLTFLFLRFTGARISEVLAIDDRRDINIRDSEVKMVILKRRKKLYKTIPIPDRLISEYLRTVKLYPELEGKIFKINRSNFYKVFSKLCKKAGIQKELAHPHILRHTRAVELVRNGVPLTIVQKLLGHYSLSNTAVYLQFSAHEVKDILKVKNLI